MRPAQTPPRRPPTTPSRRPEPASGTVTVYIDDAVQAWRGQRWAHLMADTLAELHAMAAQLGIPRRAFQNKASGAHYDVPAPLREQAIALGARAISRHTDRVLLKAVIANARSQYEADG